MIRFFVEPRDISAGRVKVWGDSLHYLKNVLRAEEGVKVKVFDGAGNEYICTVDRLGASGAVLSVIDLYRTDNEASVDITLCLGLSKQKSFEYSLQKTTELGVKVIIPLITARSFPSLSSSKFSRAEKIITEAARQCGRSVFPRLEEPREFSRAAGESSGRGLAVIPWEEEEERTFGQVLKDSSPGEITAFIGPEGGFTREEAEIASSAGILPVSLGPRILRAETAAAAVVAMIIYRYDLGGERFPGC